MATLMITKHEHEDALEGSDWNRLLAAASDGLQLPVPVNGPKITGSSRDSRDNDPRGSRSTGLTEAELEFAGILANLGVSSPVKSAPSFPNIGASPGLRADATPQTGVQAQLSRRPITKPTSKLPGKSAKPTVKPKRKPAATAPNPRSRARPIKQSVVKQEPKPGAPTMDSSPRNVSAPSENTSSTATALQNCSAVGNSALSPPRCCPEQVPDLLLAFLDSGSEPVAELLRPFAELQSHFCFTHLQRFTQLMVAYTFNPESWCMPQNPPLPTWNLDENHPGSLAKLDPSLAPQEQARVNGCASSYYDCVLSGDQSRHGPVLDVARDDAFRQQVMREIEDKLDRKTINTHGKWTDNLVHSILKICKSPSSEEAYLLSGEEAAARVEAGPVDCPIFTQGQQQFKWDTRSRPITEFFRRMEDLDRTVSVQVPSRKTHLQTCQNQKLSDIQQRFEEHRNAGTDDPWNVLDLRNPLPPAVLPAFLTGENCQLLSRVRDSVLSGATAQRTYADKVQWNEWLNVLDWVLMSEGGHNTAPHTDSHGYSTWITIQEGEFGYGWLSNPTKEERDAWMTNPHKLVGGQWRFTVLRPGQTVYFQSGTIHFVFRLRHGQTLALGGHVLQWNGIAHWISVVQAQLRNPDSTNEEMDWTAPRYLGIIKELVQNRINAGRVNDLGGQEVVDKFLELCEVRFVHFTSRRKLTWFQNFQQNTKPTPPPPKPKAQKKRKR